MAGTSKTTTNTKGKAPPAPVPANDQAELSLADLARGVLAKEFRPGVAQIRRLAEAVLAVESPKPAKGKSGDKKKDKSKKKKLAKIPGQRAKK